MRDGRDLDKAASIRLAVKLIEDGCLSKAMAHLGEHGLGDLGIPQIQAQLQKKHPQERKDWEKGGIEEMPRMELGDAKKALINICRNAGVGADRFRAEYLLRLVRGEMDGAVRGAVLGAWQKFAGHVANNDHPE